MYFCRIISVIIACNNLLYILYCYHCYDNLYVFDGNYMHWDHTMYIRVQWIWEKLEFEVLNTFRKKNSSKNLCPTKKNRLYIPPKSAESSFFVKNLCFLLHFTCTKCFENICSCAVTVYKNKIQRCRTHHFVSPNLNLHGKRNVCIKHNGFHIMLLSVQSHSAYGQPYFPWLLWMFPEGYCEFPGECCPWVDQASLVWDWNKFGLLGTPRKKVRWC